MKKTITIILILFTFTYINNNFRLNKKKQNNLQNLLKATLSERTNVFIKRKLDSNIILTQEEIIKHNKEINEKTNSIYDLSKITNITKDEIINYINSYKIPALPKYNSNKEITKDDIKIILENRNISNILENNIKKGIIIKRSNLKSFPTNMNFFKNKKIKNFDAIQETELPINTKVLIIHESKDKLYKFIISSIYIGWVKTEDIAYAKDQDWDFFDNNSSFAVITEANLTINDTILDMGIKLPLILTTKNNYYIVIPTKNEKNYISKKIISIKKDQASIGYLPYTKKNLKIQALKYENTPYSWAGMDKFVDCSSYILNIYKTFGFTFPRNTKDQEYSIGRITMLSNKTNSEKLNIIENNQLSLLYQPGHVMLYLGKQNNKHYIIHASGTDLKVTTTILDNSKYLSKIDRLITIN